MTDNTPTQTRSEVEVARLEDAAARVLTLEETILQVAEQLAGHLHDCPGATDDERRAANLLADRWATALR